MSKQVSKTAIGGFVLVAIALLIAGVMYFGSGQVFKKTNKYVLFFEGSVKGLNVGSSVVWSGVKVGTVESIVIKANLKTLTTRIPVIIEVEQDKFVYDEETKEDLKTRIKRAIEKGMRAQLTIESMVTGQLMIDMDFHPGTPAKFVGGMKEYQEIPTIQSALGKLGKTLEKLNLEQLFQEILGAVGGINDLVTSPDVSGALHDLRLAMGNLNKLLEDVDAQVEPLVTNVNETVGSFGKLAKDVNKAVDPVAKEATSTLRAYKTLGRNVDKQAGPLMTDVDKMAKAITVTANQATKTMKTLEGLVEPNSPIMVDVKGMLKELSAAARSIRAMTDYLERHPEALLQGKGRARR